MIYDNNNRTTIFQHNNVRRGKLIESALEVQICSLIYDVCFEVMDEQDETERNGKGR